MDARAAAVHNTDIRPAGAGCTTGVNDRPFFSKEERSPGADQNQPSGSLNWPAAGAALFSPMRDFQNESLSHDAVHGYIPFSSPVGLTEGEISEQRLIDDPWVQRLRQIHQLQTAWWVYPTAEHTRFQHSLGAMHLASRATAVLVDSLREVCPSCPVAATSSR